MLCEVLMLLVQWYLRGRQLSGSPAEGVDSSGRHSAGGLEVDGGRLQRLRARRLLSVNVCGHHGNGSLCRHHRDGDALARRLDERQGLGRPYRTTSYCQLLWERQKRGLLKRKKRQPDVPRQELNVKDISFYLYIGHS